MVDWEHRNRVKMHLGETHEYIFQDRGEYQLNSSDFVLSWEKMILRMTIPYDCLMIDHSCVLIWDDRTNITHIP